MKTLCPESVTALTAIRGAAAGKKRIVFVSGNFNIVHPGHLRLLRFGKECGDYLVVGVYDDNQGHSLLPEALRLEAVRATSWVDHAFLLRDPPEDFIVDLKPAIVAKGKEHENRFNAEQAAVDSYGGKLLFSSGDVTFSSIDLLRREFDRSESRVISKPEDYLQRHRLTGETLLEGLERIAGLKVAVIGDTIVDEYLTCDPLGMSQEDPTIVVTPIMKEEFIGGAAIVAAHARGIGARVNFFSIVGNDATADFVRTQLELYGVAGRLYTDESRPTTLKQRFRANEKTLLRVNHLRQHWITKEIEEKLIHDLSAGLHETDLVMFSDFSYGCLPQSLVESVIELCRHKDIPMVADSQCSSQIGDVSRFKGMTLLTPTEREARLAVRDFNAGLIILADTLKEKSVAKNIILTLGKEGILIHAELSESNRWLTDRLPALNIAPVDVAGAGDALFTSASLMMAAGYNIWESAYVGSLAAACQVGRLGNVPLSAKDLRAELQ